MREGSRNEEVGGGKGKEGGKWDIRGEGMKEGKRKEEVHIG
jgi:hypothetical protein